ncbi:MAG TPA: OpgC domain-containing protein [Candidatus Saccharimonadales bacterium]|nr:OpgC domain-containing protein [Candidatus Saccharimonadales bacterium]
MIAKSSLLKTAPSRILALDYLRGFFIIVIIVDHLWRWPSLFEVVSGRGELWASAAEGFVIISGLLVGYVRGYKNRNKPLLEVSQKLIKRGLLLYIWMLITTVALVAASWALNFKGDMAYIPIPIGHWNELVMSALRFDYVHTLTHFLYLYAIFLILSPLAIWLLRRKKAWIVACISAAMWILGVVNSIEWMQWQLLFFLPAIAGFYLDSIFAKYYSLAKKQQQVIRFGTIGLMAVTVLAAALVVLPMSPGEYESSLFGRDPITLATILTSFIWFIGLLSLFQLILPFLKRWLGWLLIAFGERSLTAYILHTIPLVLCQLLFVQFNNIWLNTLLGIGCILFTWGLLKIPHINKLIPR